MPIAVSNGNKRKGKIMSNAERLRAHIYKLLTEYPCEGIDIVRESWHDPSTIEVLCDTGDCDVFIQFQESYQDR